MKNLLLLLEDTTTQTSSGGNWTIYILLGLMVALMAWTLISGSRQKKKAEKQEQEMRDKLKVGATVMTKDGVKGKIAEVTDGDFVIETGMEGHMSYLRYVKAALWTIEPEAKEKKEEEVVTNEIK